MNSAWHGDFIRQYNGVDISVAVQVGVGKEAHKAQHHNTMLCSAHNHHLNLLHILLASGVCMS